MREMKKAKEYLKKSKRRRIFVVFLIYFVLTVVLTAPVIANITASIPGGHGDAMQIIGFVNNLEKAIDFTSAEGIGDFLYSFVRSPLKIFSTYFYRALLAKIVGTIVAYNLIWISSFFLAAVFMFLLTKYLTKNTYAAFLAGFLFSFSPAHFAYGNGFAGATHIEWIPLFVLFFIMLLKKFSLKYLFLSLIVLAIIAQSEHHYAYFILLFSAGLILFYFVPRLTEKKISRGELIKYGISFFGFVILTIYLFRGMLMTVFSGDNYLAVEIGELIPNSLDFFHFLTPSLNHLFWGDFFSEGLWPKLAEVKDIVKQKNFAEVSGYLSFTALFFFVMMVVKYEKFKKTKEIFLYFVLAIVFFTFSMGPIFSFLGPIYPVVPMPQLILYEYLPFMENVRTVGRFFPFGLLAFTIVFSFGFLMYLSKIKKKQNKFLFTSLVFVLLLAELLYLPPMVEVKTTAFIEFLQEDRGDYKVLNVGSATCYVCASQFAYYNSLHDKEAVGGMDYARPAGGYTSERTTPFVKELLYDYSDGKTANVSAIHHDFREIAPKIIREENIRFIAIDKQWIMSDDAFEALEHKDGFIRTSFYQDMIDFIENNLNVRKFWNDKEFLVYEVIFDDDSDYVVIRQPEDTSSSFKWDVGYGLDYLELKDNDFLEVRNTKNENDLYVYLLIKSEDGDEFEIGIEYGGGEKQVRVSSELQSYQLKLPYKGKNERITFKIPQEKKIVTRNIYYSDEKIERRDKEIAKIVSNIDGKAMIGPYETIDFASGGLRLSEITSISSLRDDKMYFGEEFILRGDIDWGAAGEDRDIYESSYYEGKTASYFQRKGINYLILDQFSQNFTNQQLVLLTQSYGIFEEVEKSDHYTILKINDKYLSYEGIPTVEIIAGTGGLKMGDEVKDEYGHYSVRGISDSLILEFEDNSFDQGYTVSFGITVDVNDSSSLLLKSNDEIIKSDKNGIFSVPITEDLLVLDFIDIDGNIIENIKEREYYMYDLKVVKTD